MSDTTPPESRQDLERALSDMQDKMIQLMLWRKQQLLLKQEFDDMVKAGRIATLTQAIFTEIFRRTFQDLNELQRVVVNFRAKLRQELQGLR